MKKNQKKQGATSILISTFMIIVMSVIMVGFVRVMLAEANRTSNNDLSQSAYDTALAGVEDAKIALLRYHACLSQGYTASSTGECGTIISRMRAGISSSDCSTVSNVLGREQSSNEGTIIQETSTTSNGGVAAEMVQAYTCVTIEEELADYRTTMGSDNRTRLVPIRTDNLNNVAYIKISWFSSVNATDLGVNWGTLSSSSSFNTTQLHPLSTITGSAQPPLIAATIFQADSSFKLYDLMTAKGSNATDRSTLFLKPVSSAESFPNANHSTRSSAITAEIVALSADKSENNVIPVQCTNSGDFYCNAFIRLPNTFQSTATTAGTRNQGASLIFLQLPYGTPETDFSVSLYDENGNTINLSGVQAKVDSTGRANDMYRRVEARVELVDTNFPYPEYEIQMSNTDPGALNKTFHTTINCWTARNGTSSSCANYYSNPSYATFSN